MRAYQRRKYARIDDLIELALSRGLRSRDMADDVLGALTQFVCENDAAYDSAAVHAQRVNQAGLAAQLHLLVEVWGEWRLRAVLTNRGGVLNFLAQGLDSDVAALEADVGRDHVDEYGGVL